MICPNCHQIDKVQSAAAIFKSGTTSSRSHSTSWFGPSYRTDTRHQTDLARRLSPPPNRTAGLVVSMIIITTGSYYFWGLLAHRSNANTQHLPVSYETGITIINVLALLLLLRIILDARRRSVYVRHWQKLWYCHRCDLEFTPQETAV